jgi:hypothetical protein
MYHSPSHLVIYIFPKHRAMTSREPHYRPTKFHRVTNSVLLGEETMSQQLYYKLIYLPSLTFESFRISLVDIFVFSLEVSLFRLRRFSSTSISTHLRLLVTLSVSYFRSVIFSSGIPARSTPSNSISKNSK